MDLAKPMSPLKVRRLSSNSFLLIFRLIGETIVQSVRDRVIAVVRSNVSLECRAANSLAVRWLYKLMKVEVSSRIRIKASAGRSILEIDNVQMSDAGTYQCKIGVKLARIHLSVDLPSTPQIVTHPENVTAVAGERVELVCDAIGKPPLIMSWLKRTSRGDVEISRNRILAYEAVTKRQAGIYICVAKNTNGHSESKTATIHVQERGTYQIQKHFGSWQCHDFRTQFYTCSKTERRCCPHLPLFRLYGHVDKKRSAG